VNADQAPNAPARRYTRPTGAAEAQLQKQHGYRANQAFEPLPAPTGSLPYRVSLEEVLGQDAVNAIRAAGSLSFHVGGDTGGVKAPQPQQIVAIQMAADLQSHDPKPAFFYHLGDVVYFNGQRPEYYPQFYEPYTEYPAPIVAIPGNHDGDPLDPTAEPSLAAFVENFCATQPHLTAEAQVAAGKR
jgi:hypothetical protein